MQESVATRLLDAIFVSMRKLVDIEKLSEETGFSVRTLRTFIAGKKIPFLKIGHRTMRFDPDKVEKALERFEIKEVGTK
jgi:excisionase family DNA binding protein